MIKQKILLTGASGSMGFETFKLIWENRDSFEIVLLLRPSKKNRKLFRKYAKVAGWNRNSTSSIFRGDGLRIVWGDILNKEDLVEACKGIDYCLHTAALISPAADRDPEMARKINNLGTKTLVEVIEAEDAEHIKFVYIGSVAEYGDRLPPIHVGRTGDPLIPSVFDHYAESKIEAEIAVMQSKIKYKVSLRQTFIMIPRLFSLMDPIMFHQPINSFMECITAKDSGRALFSCLSIPGDSDFWNQYYNLSGGHSCRTTFLEFLDRIYALLGLRYSRVMERNWFALKNFHMQFYEDSIKLNNYLKHWEGGLSLEEFYKEVWKGLPISLKLTSRLCRNISFIRWIVERITYSQLKALAYKEHGTLKWIKDGEIDRIQAFYGSEENFRAIPSWNESLPNLDINQSYSRLDHGYDEEKEYFTVLDLEKAAIFRKGLFLGSADDRENNKDWNGDLSDMQVWECRYKHTFELTAHSVLKGGHWCLECISSHINPST